VSDELKSQAEKLSGLMVEDPVLCHIWYDGSEDPDGRYVQVHTLRKTQTGNWVLIGYDMKKKEHRSFRVEKIDHIEIVS
jgi:predicted DNA-binding transcriptional regulator YafY